MFVGQLVERLLPTPEILGSNPVISKSTVLKFYLKDENKEKRPKMAQNFDM